MSDKFVFAGFDSPSYTQIPDPFFDSLMVNLNEAELRVLLYLMRRTFGFKKNEDRVSIKQLVEGITTREGKVLDYGTGMSKSAVQRGLKGLREKQVIVAERNRSLEHGDTATSYRVRLVGDPIDDPWSASEPGGDPLATSPVIQQRHPQETVKQQTVRQFEVSKQLNITNEEIEDRAMIGQYVEDFAREFRDEAPLASSTTRAYKLYVRSEFTIDDFIAAMLDARRRTKESNVQKPSTKGREGEKAKMPYFFAILEDVCGLRISDAG